MPKLPFLLALLLAIPLLAPAQRHQVTVAQDGSGDYRTVQAAFDAVPDGNAQWLTIVVRPGIYKEKLTLAAAKTHVRLRGAGPGPSAVVLTYDNYNQKINPATGQNFGTTGSSSTHLYASDFTAENLTFENAAGPVGQAVAAWVAGDRSYFKNCRFLGFQDTLYTYGHGARQLYDNCYIEGTVDFIFGSSTAWFEGCTLVGKKAGFFTAASTPDTTRFGYVFNRCKVMGTPDAPAGSFYLGRPWRPYAKVVYLGCELGAVVQPAGWDEWGKESNQRTTYYAEYHSTGPGAPAGQRARWAHLLSKDEASLYTRATVLRGWQPE